MRELSIMAGFVLIGSLLIYCWVHDTPPVPPVCCPQCDGRLLPMDPDTTQGYTHFCESCGRMYSRSLTELPR